MADSYRKTVASGSDPSDGKRNVGGKTFGALSERYLDEYARRRKRSHARDEQNLKNHILPKWKNRAYATIKRADVIELIEGLISDGKPTLANRVQSLISSIFTFAMDAALVEFNPCHRLRKRGKENIGRRVLGDLEIFLFWHNIITPRAVRRTGLGLRLALLTGARISEIAGINLGELSEMTEPTASAWMLPGNRTKNGRDHLIPLSPLARNTILELISMIDDGEKFLLPTRSGIRTGPMRGNSLTQAMANFSDRISGNADAVTTWLADPPSPHDLRRTVETRLAALRIPKEIRDRVLNHTSGDVGSKHYNLHDYVDEKRDALNLWSLAVAAIIDPSGPSTVASASTRKASP